MDNLTRRQAINATIATIAASLGLPAVRLAPANTDTVAKAQPAPAYTLRLTDGRVYQHALATSDLSEGDWVTLTSDMHAARVSPTERPSAVSLGAATRGEYVWVQCAGSYRANVV